MKRLVKIRVRVALYRVLLITMINCLLHRRENHARLFFFIPLLAKNCSVCFAYLGSSSRRAAQNGHTGSADRCAYARGLGACWSSSANIITSSSSTSLAFSSNLAVFLTFLRAAFLGFIELQSFVAYHAFVMTSLALPVDSCVCGRAVWDRFSRTRFSCDRAGEADILTFLLILCVSLKQSFVT